MKTLFVSGALFLVTLTASADPAPVRNLATYRANQALKANFGEVENVDWKLAMGNMVRADFDQEGASYSLFFNAEGDLLATTRKLAENEMPFALRKAIAAKFGKGTTQEAFELQNDEGQAWFFRAVHKGKTSVWKGYDNGRIEAFDLKP
jgi:hypothetical protein